MSSSMAAGCRKLSEASFAAALLNVAASRSLPELGHALHQEIGRLIGSRSVGLYAIVEGRPRLLFSRQAAQGFLRDYDAGSDRDGLVDRICECGEPVDGFTAMGPDQWRKSGSFDLLKRWGYQHCMAGPLCVERRVIGIVYTADQEKTCPYGPPLLQRMEILCRAGSIALANMMEAGVDPLVWESLPDCGASESRATADPALPAMRLPRRSREVAVLVAQGRSNKEIARALGLSVHTVKEYVGNLCKRLGAQNRTELAHRVFELR